MPNTLTTPNQPRRRGGTTPQPVTAEQCRLGECEHYREITRLRRNLHDGLGPGLAAIMLRTDVLTRLLATNPDEAESMLRELRDEAAQFMTDFRRLLTTQCPSELDGQRLDDALCLLARRTSRLTHDALTVDVGVDPAVSGTGPATQAAAFWIAKEALTNVVKHAEADTCTIRCWADAGLWLEITDNGTGRAPGAGPGLGLTSMRDRAAELGGWCEISSGGAGYGVTVRAHLPAAPCDSGTPCSEVT